MTSAIDRLSFIEFQSPTLVEKAPEGGDWLHEIKYDGYRTQLVVEGGKARAFTRRGYDWSHRYKRIVQAAASLPVKSAIIDGEAVVLGDTGLPDYQALERELGNPSSLRMTLYAFDLLYLDGRDLREQPLVKRKAALKKLLTETEPTLTYAEHLEVNGKDMFDHACRMGIEGIVSKRADAHYRSGVQTSWVKVKCVKSDTFPIVAFVEKLGAQPRRIASLYIGRREGDRLLYAGKAQTGYTLDRLVVDLDPGEGVPWDAVIEATLALRGILEAAGLESWPKVTGGKGIHLMAPLVAKMTHDSARKLAKSLAHRLVDTDPDRYLLSADPAARGGRIFLDYLRNGRGNTAIGAFSPRARPGFPIAHPVPWKQVEAGIRPDVFTLAQPFRPARRKAA
ncbi:RNA ligase family protein [Mesorhizobium sp. LNJC403B00]|uniref:non-homologous end-joining DNA ligase LigD n=1 Tax=Mesorhizobium sp. LNJC403B00 TaxID=1287280 RepID=UPI0003CF0E94|nr:RNA ligase family protein [Mesorhizobium sp. LNJC403B00]ESX91417.1 ATP-dependent DNA ligase [Mesorhizobium sp. LNJC403B00]